MVPAGSFTMGSPPDEPERESWKAGCESPRHKVMIAKPFAIGRFAVTFWPSVTRRNGTRTGRPSRSAPRACPRTKAGGAATGPSSMWIGMTPKPTRNG